MICQHQPNAVPTPNFLPPPLPILLYFTRAMAHSNGLLNFSTSNLLTPLGVNQTLLQDPNLSGRSLTSSLHLSPPAPLDSPIGLDNTPLEQLSSKYAAVAQVIQFRDSLSRQISRTTDHISNLYDDLNKLREENKLLQHQLRYLIPSSNADQLILPVLLTQLSALWRLRQWRSSPQSCWTPRNLPNALRNFQSQSSGNSRTRAPTLMQHHRPPTPPVPLSK